MPLRVKGTSYDLNREGMIVLLVTSDVQSQEIMTHSQVASSKDPAKLQEKIIRDLSTKIQQEVYGKIPELARKLYEMTTEFDRPISKAAYEEIIEECSVLIDKPRG